MARALAPVDPEVLDEERGRRPSVRGCASSPRPAAAACPRRPAGSPSSPPSRPRARGGRRPSGRRGAAGRPPASRDARRGAGRRSPASRAVVTNASASASSRSRARDRERPGRDAAEVEVRREPRGRVGREVVVPARAVPVDPAPQPRARPLGADRLPAAMHRRDFVLNQHKVRCPPERAPGELVLNQHKALRAPRSGAGSPSARAAASRTVRPTRRGSTA